MLSFYYPTDQYFSAVCVFVSKAPFLINQPAECVVYIVHVA